MLDRVVIQMTLWVLWLVRQFISIDRRTYLLLSAGALQPLLAHIGMLRAHAVYLKLRIAARHTTSFLKPKDTWTAMAGNFRGYRS